MGHVRRGCGKKAKLFVPTKVSKKTTVCPTKKRG